MNQRAWTTDLRFFSSSSGTVDLTFLTRINGVRTTEPVAVTPVWRVLECVTGGRSLFISRFQVYQQLIGR
jgi:hypothetical protein